MMDSDATPHEEKESPEIDIAKSLAEAAAGLANLNTPIAITGGSDQTTLKYETTLQIPSSFAYTASPDPENVLRIMLEAGSFTDQTHEQCAYILQRIDQVKSLERCNCLSEGQKSDRFQKDKMNAWVYNPTKRKHSDDKEWIGPVLIVTAPSSNKKESKRRGLHFGGRQFKVKNFESVIVTHGEDRTEGLIGRKYQLYRPRVIPPLSQQLISLPNIELNSFKRFKPDGYQEMVPHHPHPMGIPGLFPFKPDGFQSMYASFQQQLMESQKRGDFVNPLQSRAGQQASSTSSKSIPDDMDATKIQIQLQPNGLYVNPQTGEVVQEKVKDIKTKISSELTGMGRKEKMRVLSDLYDELNKSLCDQIKLNADAKNAVKESDEEEEDEDQEGGEGGEDAGSSDAEDGENSPPPGAADTEHDQRSTTPDMSQLPIKPEPGLESAPQETVDSADKTKTSSDKDLPVAASQKKKAKLSAKTSPFPMDGMAGGFPLSQGLDRGMFMYQHSMNPYSAMNSAFGQNQRQALLQQSMSRMNGQLAMARLSGGLGMRGAGMMNNFNMYSPQAAAMMMADQLSQQSMSSTPFVGSYQMSNQSEVLSSALKAMAQKHTSSSPSNTANTGNSSSSSSAPSSSVASTSAAASVV